MPRKMARQTLERHAGACYAGSRPYLGSGVLGSPENRYNLPHFRVHPGNPGWWDVDLNGGRNAHEFYLPDGLYVVGQNRFAGHDQIRAFYAWRARRESTTSRHLINNLQVFATDDHHARLVAALSLFRANGPPPVQRPRRA